MCLHKKSDYSQKGHISWHCAVSELSAAVGIDTKDKDACNYMYALIKIFFFFFFYPLFYSEKCADYSQKIDVILMRGRNKHSTQMTQDNYIILADRLELI